MAILVKKNLSNLLQESGRKYAKQVATTKRVLGWLGQPSVMEGGACATKMAALPVLLDLAC